MEGSTEAEWTEGSTQDESMAGSTEAEWMDQLMMNG
jgi:hypothetical protein